MFKFRVESVIQIIKDLKNILVKNNIGFIGMYKLLEDYVRNRNVSCQIYKDIKEKYLIKPIKIESLDSHYTFDINYLNEDISKAFGIKYILSILVCFSRKANIYGINIENSDIY